jgi:hypothetical protein
MNDENRNRWIWAPMIGHGIALVTLGGIVGNVQSPDTALYALGPSISWFAIGLLVSAIGASVEGDFYSKTGVLPSLRARSLDIEERRVAILSSLADIEKIIPQSGATIAEQAASRPRIKALEAQSNMVGSLIGTLEKDIASLEKWLANGTRHAIVAGLLQGSAHGIFLVGILTFLVPLWTGELHLEKPDEVSRPIAVAKPPTAKPSEGVPPAPKAKASTPE